MYSIVTQLPKANWVRVFLGACSVHNASRFFVGHGIAAGEIGQGLGYAIPCSFSKLGWRVFPEYDGGGWT
jgi:hypothetical protein